MQQESVLREPLILGDKTYHQITEDVCAPVEGKANKYWYIVFTLSVIVALWGVGCILYTIGRGIGTWGLNTTVDWAWDITNFVWWVGIGHAGTLISAVLLLFRQKWRMAINRSAEAMTIFAVMMAALFPGIHMGRIWMGYWVFPLTNTYGSLWVNFNSPLLWDVFAISTYFSVSLVFWYIGLIPDFATIRDRAVKPIQKMAYSTLSFGWTGDVKAWIRFEEVSLVLGLFSTLYCIHGLCYIGSSGMAHDNLSALFRCWCNLLWICHGNDTSNHCKKGLEPRILHHDKTRRIHEHRNRNYGFNGGCRISE